MKKNYPGKMRKIKIKFCIDCDDIAGLICKSCGSNLCRTCSKRKSGLCLDCFDEYALQELLNNEDYDDSLDERI